jgi:hypothetical protein
MTFASRLAAVALAVATAGALGAATANASAASSGGGCATGSHIKGCISASGSHLEPDLYTLNNSGCSSVGIEVLNASNSAIVWQDDVVNSGCTVGIHGPWALDTANSSVVNGGTYYTVAWMNFTNGTSNQVISQNETLSY